ncbi:MAG TPA: hypothetical protein VMX94_05755 [Armatimonadota bacterium]|nr:hypothetical protein [Armatimonadota bacterium]
MEERPTTEHPHVRRGPPPWVWVLIVLAALILVFVVWWTIAAQGPRQTVVVVPEEERPAVPPVQRPPAERPPEQPVVVEREPPVNIYIGREQPRPSVIVVPKGEQPPEAMERLRQVNLPGRFRYQGKTWEPADQAVSSEDADLKDTGASVDGNIVYAERDDQPPYDELYLETEPGSGIYIKYEPA